MLATELLGQRGDRAVGLQRRAGRAERIVLVRDGDSEDGHDRVTGVLLDGPSVAGEHRGDRLEVALQHDPERLGIQRLCERHRLHDVDEEDRDQPAELHRRLGGCSLGQERGVLSEDRGLELLELGAGLETELLGERRARRAIRGERVGLTPRAVEREHQQLAQPLPQRELADERLQLRDHVGGGAQLDFGRDPLLDGHGAELVEAPRLGLRPLLEGELGQRRAAPEVERAREQRAALPRGRDPCVGEHPLEAPGVELLC